MTKEEIDVVRNSYVFGKNGILWVPRLLDEIERLTAELERMERELADKDVEGVCNLCGKRFPSSAF